MAKAAPAKKSTPTKPASVKAARPRRTTPAATPTQPTGTPDLYGSIHALLHTMRLIERHEEPLCSMHDELKRTGKLSAPQRRKLQQLIHDLPAHDYQADLEALRRAVSA